MDTIDDAVNLFWYCFLINVQAVDVFLNKVKACCINETWDNDAIQDFFFTGNQTVVVTAAVVSPKFNKVCREMTSELILAIPINMQKFN